MPTSSKYGKLYTALMINKLNELAPIESILDIGVGEEPILIFYHLT
jgi:hypothetical protein